jgi:hypothetical protein
MPAANAAQTNWTSGELSPRLYGRADIEQYGNGARSLLNFTVLPQGGITRRVGSYFVDETKDSSKASRLVRFVFSTVQAYVLELGDLYFRVYRNHARVAATEVVTPWTEAQAPQVNFVQSADVLFAVHPLYRPRRITRTSDTAWTLTDFTTINGPWQETNLGTVTMTASGTTGAITVTASSATFAATDVGRLVGIAGQAAGYNPAGVYAVGAVVYGTVSGVNRLYRCIVAGTASSGLNSGGEGDYIGDGTAAWRYVGRGTRAWGYATITGFTSTTQVSASVVDSIPATTATREWRLGAWSDTTGWPSAVAFHQERMVFARGQTIWMSRTGDFTDFTPTFDDGEVVATMAITLTIADDEVQDVRWMVSHPRGLVVGTASAEFLVGQASNNEPLGPANVRAVRQSDRGSVASLQPARSAGAVMFVQKAGLKLRELVYDFQADALVTPDLTILAEHITSPGIKDLAYAEEPDGQLWAARNDGAALSLTYERDQRVRAWSRHALGGGGAVESVASIPNPEGTADEIYLLVRRTISGATKRYVEFIEAPFRPLIDGQASMYFVDCGLSYAGVATSTVTGLGHLEGETVQVVADGSVRVPQVVTGGAVAITGPAATRVHVGYGYESRMVTMAVDAGGGKGPAQGQAKRIHEVILRLVDSVGGKVGYEGQEERIEYRRPVDAMDTAVPLFTGDKLVRPAGGPDRDGIVSIVCDQPLPLTVTMMIRGLVTHG